MQLATTGMRMRETLEIWRGFYPDAELDQERLRESLIGLMVKGLRDSGRPKAGAIETLALCREAGCRMAIASSSPMEVIRAAVDRLDAVRPGLKGWFHETLSAEAEIRGKPFPDVYLSAAGKLGVEPGDCIAFEDSVHGLRSSHAAGMHCIAVPEEHNRGRSDYAIAHRILDSLEEFKRDYLRR